MFDSLSQKFSLIRRRLNLIRNLSKLPTPQFEELQFALNPPAGIIPSIVTPQGIRSAMLLHWVESVYDLTDFERLLGELIGSACQDVVPSTPSQVITNKLPSKSENHSREGCLSDEFTHENRETICAEHKYNVDYTCLENKYSDCLYFKFEVHEDIYSTAEKISLYLTLNFNEQWEPIPPLENLEIEKVKFGLRGGELRLTLRNGSTSYKSRAFVKKLSLPSNHVLSLTKESKESGEKLNSDSFLCDASTKGSDTNPVWSFRLNKLDQEILFGLVDECLCEVDIEDLPCNIEAEFQVLKRDIRILDYDEPLPLNISNSRKKHIKRELELHFYPQFQSYLSRALITVGPSPRSKNDRSSFAGEL